MAKLANSIDDLKFFMKLGTVEGANTWTETNTSTTTRISNTNSNYASSGYTTTSTSSTEKNRFFLKQTDGKEIEVELSGNAFTVRDGHEVGIFYVQHKDEELGYPVIYHNHNTDNRWVRSASFSRARGEAFKAGCGTIAALIVGLGGLALGLAAADSPRDTGINTNPFFLVGAISLALAVYLMWKSGTNQRRKADIDQKILEVGNRQLDRRVAQSERLPLSTG